MKLTKKERNVHGQREPLGPHGSALGPQGLVPQGFSDTNMLVFPTENARVGGLDQREAPTRRDSRCSGI